MSRKSDFLYEVYITDEGSCRQGDGSRKPVPGKEGRKEKESVVLHLNPHKYLEGDKKDKCEKNRIQ